MDPSEYAALSADVARTFVAALDGYVRGIVVDRGLDDQGLDAAITEAETWLDTRFGQWMEATPTRQAGSPLAMFREALRFPSAALLSAGAEAVDRDPQQVEALPGDVLDLSPATSQQLGEEAFAAHVAWGLGRAEAVAGMVPSSASGRPAAATAMDVALVSGNLMDRTRIAEVVEGAGFSLVVWRNPGAVTAGLESGPLPVVAFVDLVHPAANGIMADLVAAGVRTVAFGPHVDDFALVAARALGVADALPRSRFFHRLPSLLPQAV